MQATDRGLSVFRHYLPVPFRIGKKFLNPLYKDTKASCNVYYDRRHSVYKMKDFGNEEYSGDCFELVGTMTGLSCRNAKDFVEIMRIIDHDLHLGLADGYENCVDTSSVQVVCPPTPEQVIKKIRPYNIVPRAFNETDRIFWSKSRITEHTLNKYNVRPLHSFSSVNQEGKSYTLTETAQEPMYGYVGDKYIKIYRPRSEMRFLYAGDLGDNYCFGLDQLSAKGDLLFITGGEKDVMSLAANGFHAICFNSETTVIPTSVLMLLSYRFKHIVLLYDMDKTGLEVSAKRQEELKPFALKRLLLPLSGTKEEKDVTDYFALGHTEIVLKPFGFIIQGRYVSIKIMRVGFQQPATCGTNDSIGERCAAGNTREPALHHRRGGYGEKQLCGRPDCRCCETGKRGGHRHAGRFH